METPEDTIRRLRHLLADVIACEVERWSRTTTDNDVTLVIPRMLYNDIRQEIASE